MMIHETVSTTAAASTWHHGHGCSRANIPAALTETHQCSSEYSECDVTAYTWTSKSRQR